MQRNRNTVKVLDVKGTPLANCRTQKARQLINDGKAKIVRLFPQMIIQLTWEVIPDSSELVEGGTANVEEKEG